MGFIHDCYNFRLGIFVFTDKLIFRSLQ